MPIVRALDSSTNQWLCASFKQAYPEYFETEECPPKLDFSNLNEAHSSSFEIIQPINEVEQLISLALLREDCDRFTHLKALGDLYFPFIDSVLVENELSLAFRYLPVALSGFNPSYTANKGTGIWNMNQLEAQRFGVQVKDSIDYRYNLNNSTLSYVSKIKNLKDQLRFDEAVLASIVEGLAPVKSRLIHNNYQLQAFLSNSPKQTLEWLAGYKTLAAYFDHLTLPNRGKDYQQMLEGFVEVYPSKKAKFEAYGAVLGIPISELRNLNPIYPKNEALANSALVLPVEYAKKFNEIEEDVYAHEAKQRIIDAKKQEEEKRRIEELRKREEVIHTVRSGEVLGLIAQRYKVSIHDIKSWNNLKRDMIYVGQKLSIQSNKPSSSKEPKVEEPTAKESNTDSGNSQSKEVSYTVKSGDSLWLIAQKYPGVSAENIMEWNNIGSDLSPGQKLTIRIIE